MPTPEAGGSALDRNELLKKASFSTRDRQSKKQVETRHTRYDDLLESVYDAAVIASPSGKIIEVNGRTEEFTGYDREALCGSMTMMDVIDGADDEILRSVSETLLTERFALLHAFCRRKDGTLFPAEIAVNRLVMDHVRLCFFIRDVTVRYHAEEQLRVEHAALQICASGIAICEVDGEIGYVNPAFATMIGVDEETLLGANIRTVLSEEHVAPLMENALEGEQAWMTEFDIAREDGATLFLQVSAACIYAEDGLVRNIVFSVADITAHQGS